MDPGAQIELLALLSGVRRLPLKEAKTLSEEHKAVLLIVLGHRRKGSLQNQGGGDTRLEASSILDDLLSQGLIYCAVCLAGPTRGIKGGFHLTGKKRDFRRTPQQKSECFPQPHIRAPRFLVALHAELSGEVLAPKSSAVSPRNVVNEGCTA
jgi:hypothetical protein